jgi:hypothetical protein
MRPDPVIVCAAMRHRPTGLIVAGARHFDTVMRPIIEKLGLGHVDWDQGFIDQYQQFYDRKTAWKIADVNGQLRRPTTYERTYAPRPAGVGDEGILFSENLY